MDEVDARREMGAILDELAALPADAFAEKVALRDRQEELRAFLENPEGGEEIKARWAKGRRANSTPTTARKWSSRRSRAAVEAAEASDAAPLRRPHRRRVGCLCGDAIVGGCRARESIFQQSGRRLPVVNSACFSRPPVHHYRPKGRSTPSSGI